MIRRIAIASLIIALSVVLPARAASLKRTGSSFQSAPPASMYFHAEIQEQVLPSPLPPKPRPHRSVSSPVGPAVHVSHPWPHAPACCGPSAAEVRAMITATFGAHAAAALAVASCESHDDWQAQNPYSGAAGIFQFVPSHWWDGTKYLWNVWDAQTNINAALSMSSGGTDWSAWSCRP